ncbi:MAG TPA: hypothetical protein PLB12_04595 [Candidatus Goldiibacteriota bacterium]|nr:hypothetical protein [Candidatus Goldiibacteriota bacterium]HPN63934.1 hypothetical protein [Candidatus Goldiibacteriota bacterium]HRQ43609.1 hypothetical protein [Candidatus Goldiibacteriota bacterium]
MDNKNTKKLKFLAVFFTAAVLFSAASNIVISMKEDKISNQAALDKKIYSEAIMLRKNISQLASIQAAGPVMPDAARESFDKVEKSLVYFAAAMPENKNAIDEIMKSAARIKDGAMSGSLPEGSWRIFGQADEFVGSVIKSVSGKDYRLPEWALFLTVVCRVLWAAFFAAFAGFMYFAVSGLYKEGYFGRIIKNPVVSGLFRFINVLM